MGTLFTEAAGAALTTLKGVQNWEGSTNLNTYSTDIQNWQPPTSATVHDNESFTPTAQNGRVFDYFTSLDSASYTLKAKIKSAGNTSLSWETFNSASGSTQPLTVTSEWADYEVTILGKTGGGTSAFGIRDSNTSGFGVISVTDFQVEELAYSTPLIPTSGASASRLDNDSQDAYPSGLDNNFIWGCDWTPSNTNASTLLESGNVRVYYDGTNVKFTKGAFTASKAITVVADTKYTIKIQQHDASGMDLWIDDSIGTNNTDVTDAATGSVLQLGARIALTEFVNGELGEVSVNAIAMTALANIWTIIADINRIDADTTRLTLTDIGFGLDGSKFEITGVGGTALYEGLQFTATRVNSDNVDIDWLEHAITAPADTWTVGGMVRLYQTPATCDGAMRVIFNPHTISAITSTGDTGEVVIDNVLNSNRSLTHTLAGGSDHLITPTLATGSLVNAVALVDLIATKSDGSIDIDCKIRIRGGGATLPVDVIYPAISDRYLSDELPADGYPGIVDGHNTNDPVPHFVAYIPPIVSDGTEKIDIIDSVAGTSLEFSEMMMCSYWSPVAAQNFNYESQTKGQIKADDVWRGAALHRNRDGLARTRNAVLEMMDETDATYADLIAKSGRTILFDSYPIETGKRWRTMVAGYLTGDINYDELRPGGSWPISIIDSKLHEDI